MAMNLFNSSVFVLLISLSTGITLAQTSTTELSCPAPTAGNPCHGVGNNPGQVQSVANPVDVTTGNKFQEELDYFGGPQNSGLEFFRYYNSTQLTPSLIGQGWRHSYNRKLYLHGKRPQILLDDSTRLMFEPQQGNLISSRNNEYGSLQRMPLKDVVKRIDWATAAIPPFKQSLSQFFSRDYLKTLRNDLWLWEYPSKAIDVFNSKGNLIISQMPATEAVFIERETKPGPTYKAILRVQNQSELSLDFHYEILGKGARLSQIDTPTGSLLFKHDLPKDEQEPRLRGLTHFNEAKVVYDYHDASQQSPYLLQRARHFSESTQEPYRDVAWDYGSHGRTKQVTFHRHEGLDAPLYMNLDYVKIPQHNGDTGLTELTQTYKQQQSKTRFHTTQLAQRFLLTKTEGAPCFKCPSAGTQSEYNSDGYLIAYNGLDIKRDSQNRIDSIGVPHRGWPGLRIYYDQDAKPYAWSSLYTGKTFYEIDPDTLYPRYKNFANGTRMHNSYNAHRKFWDSDFYKKVGAQGYRFNPDRSLIKETGFVRYMAQSTVDKKILTIKKYTNNIKQLVIRRWPPHSTTSLLRDIFIPYNDSGYVEHQLPEMGKVFYQYDENKQLKNIWWEKKNAQKGDKWQLVYQRVNHTERQFGNGLLLRARKNQGIYKNSIRLELLKEGLEAPYWQEIRYHHNNGLLAAEHHLAPALGINRFRNYEFNLHGQLIRLDTEDANNSTTSDLYAWKPGGASLGRQTTHKTIKEGAVDKQQKLIVNSIQRDRSGLIQSMNELQLVYDESNVLTELKKGEETLATYAYDGLTHRIYKNTPKGETQYYYLNQQLVAEAFVPSSSSVQDYSNSWNEPPHLTKRYLYDGILPVAMIDYSEDNLGKLYYIHSDGAGQPFMLTDQSQKVVWLADNEVFGHSRPIIENIEFNLRLPGQYYDAESGLHQNLYRNYDPIAGHYLEPDVLGPVGNNETFGYANQNPRQFIDPLGLYMFVFDGTTNTPESQTNAYKLGQLYKETVHYIEGIGTQEAQDKVDKFMADYRQQTNLHHKVSESPLIQRSYANSLLEWEVPEFIPGMTEDKLFAGMAPYLLNMQWSRLINEMIKATSQGAILNESFDIDLAGFSRGAALASIFANKIAQYTDKNYFQYKAKWLPLGQQDIKACVNLRFVGLFDTVHQLGFLGANNENYNYTTSPAWTRYAHAVALNEHRKIMPLTRFKDDNTTNVDEHGFLGSHSDIGGAIFSTDLTARSNPYPGTYGDLSNIPLAWIYDKAIYHEVPLKDLNALSQWQLDTVKNPLLHLNNKHEQYNTDDWWKWSDREVYSSNGKKLGKQFRSKDLGHSARSDHIAWVNFQEIETIQDPIFYPEGYPYGIVRAREYLDFLKDTIKWESSLKVIALEQ